MSSVPCSAVQCSAVLFCAGGWERKNHASAELEPWEWEQAHFGAWLIMSSPLVLGFDLRNDSLVSAAWPFIANTEALAVSQSYAGHPGWRFAAWTPAGSRPIDWYSRRVSNPSVSRSQLLIAAV